MLNCRACLWRCVDALDVPTANAYRLQRTINHQAKPSQRRHASTQDTVRSSKESDYRASALHKLTKRGEEPWKQSAVRANQKSRERAVLRREVPSTPNLEKLQKRDPSISEAEWNQRKRELRFLQDPLELATFVRKELKKDKIKEMYQLVIMASRSMDCVVSWNHIIDHLLAKKKVNEALKIYNDMKKRAQFPDSYTISIILRGLAMNAQTSGVLSKALSVYHSLSAPNSRVEPSIIHTNAALLVCARALDMDALWGIAGKIPESGPGQANVITYVTIINAIRQNILVNAPRGETEEEIAARKERGIMEGRRIWEEIVTKWSNADLEIDEDLVCAMGRLLLVGARPRDWDDVLSLIEQTMDIPRFVPRLGTVEREKSGEPRLRAPNVPEAYRFDDDHLSPNQTPMRGSEFLALVPKKAGSATSGPTRYVKPGTNTLSLVQEACMKIVAQKAAHQYWNLLTDPNTYNVKPDFENLNVRLRLLRQTRASTLALKVLRDDMISQRIKPTRGTFRIAMSTCIRDKNNHHSLNTGGQILALLLQSFEDADPKTVTMYADLATSFPLAKGTDLLNALTALHPIVKNLRVQLGVGGRSLTTLAGEERGDAIAALRKVYGLYDRLLFSNLIEESEKTPLKVERARLGAFLNRVANRNGDLRDGAVAAAEDEERDGERERDAGMERGSRKRGEFS